MHLFEQLVFLHRRRVAERRRAPCWSPFFFELREAGVPVTITEFLTLLEGAAGARRRRLSAEDFYYFARTCLVKDERHFDRFDRAFAAALQGRRRSCSSASSRELPAEWLQGASPSAR